MSQSHVPPDQPQPGATVSSRAADPSTTDPQLRRSMHTRNAGPPADGADRPEMVVLRALEILEREARAWAEAREQSGAVASRDLLPPEEVTREL